MISYYLGVFTTGFLVGAGFSIWLSYILRTRRKAKELVVKFLAEEKNKEKNK